MEMETSLQQMMARLLAEMKASQEKMNAEMEARSEARQEKMNAEMEARAEGSQVKADAELKATVHSMRSDIERSLHQQMGALLEGSKSFGTRTTFCRVPPVACSDNSEDDVITSEESSEEMEAANPEVTPDETEAAVERQELFKEHIDFDNFASSEDRYGYQRLAVRRCRGAKKRSQDSVGSRQKSSAARKRVIRRAVPAVPKGQMLKSPGKDGTAKRAPKGRRLENLRQKGQECSVGIRNRDRGSRQQLCLRMRRKSDGNSRKPTRLEMANLIVGSTTGVQGVNVWTFWKVRPPPKRKKELRTA
jgi:hypothetical protein